MTKKWWKEGVIYQIYPRSFKDSNEDGIGDIRGIIQKIDHLVDLGIDIVWLGPVYESPNDDNGYDISDYRNIHPEFGTMADFDELLEKLHAKGIKLIMDLVVNHTSDEHYWFQESRKSKDNPYRDYYIWKDPKNGKEPNNWPSFFGGSAWEWDEQSEQYYLHLFTKKQPDLNWENPRVREEVIDILRFWCEKGIDGFRMDVIPLISKRLEFADSPFDNFIDTVTNVYSNGPKVHDYIHEMYEKVLKHYDVMTVGEGPGIHKGVGLDYVGENRGELNMIFHLDHMFMSFGDGGRFDSKEIDFIAFKKLFAQWDEALGDEGWLSVFLDNHDFPRMVSRFGNDRHFRSESAQMLAILILTLRGTPCIYQGSEIGMTNLLLEESEFRDVETLNYFKSIYADNGDMNTAIETANIHGRDNVRTPMQWDASINAGFTSHEPWIKVNPNYSEINVQTSQNETNSILKFYQKMLEFRKTNEIFIYGELKFLALEHKSLFAYTRILGKEKVLVLLNFSNDDLSFADSILFDNLEWIFGNYEANENKMLKPWEGRIYKIS